MDYLKKYNLTDLDIIDIKENLDDLDYEEFLNNQENIENIIKYLLNIGISNIKDILKYKPYIFYDSLDTIKSKIDKIENFVDLANENIVNFQLIGY